MSRSASLCATRRSRGLSPHLDTCIDQLRRCLHQRMVRMNSPCVMPTATGLDEGKRPHVRICSNAALLRALGLGVCVAASVCSLKGPWRPTWLPDRPHMGALA
eukprot:358130-Chlamydomonas_euryale.AAC.8